MKYRKHSELQNSYPKTPETLAQNYTEGNSDDDVVYNGKFPDNFITFSSITVDDKVIGEIKYVDNMDFRFLVKFGENDYWTSRGFYNDLRDALDKNQPYFNKETVTLATVDYQLLNTYWQNMKFVGNIGTNEKDGSGELYAEVTITETLDMRLEMLTHINWLVSDKEDLRPVNTFGKWELYTTNYLGFDEQVIFTSGSITTPVPIGREIDRNAGSSDLRDAIGNVTSSDIPDDREVDRDGGSGDLRDVEEITVTEPVPDDRDTRSFFDYIRGR